MEYNNIVAYLEIVQTRNLTKAANNLFLPQSTVSNRLKALEQEIGHALVLRARGKRMVQLTEYGEAFAVIAERWKAVIEETNTLNERSFVTLHIATVQSIYDELLANLIYDFYQENPSIKISVRVCDSSVVCSLIEHHEIDFGFSSYEPYQQNIHSELLLRQEFCIVLSSMPEETVPEKLDLKTLDCSKEIRITGGYLKTLESWKEKYLSAPDLCHLEFNDAVQAAKFLSLPGYWMLCSEAVANNICAILPVKKFTLSNPPRALPVYLLKRNRSRLENMYLHKFEDALRKRLAERTQFSCF